MVNDFQLGCQYKLGFYKVSDSLNELMLNTVLILTQHACPEKYKARKFMGGIAGKSAN